MKQHLRFIDRQSTSSQSAEREMHRFGVKLMEGGLLNVSAFLEPLQNWDSLRGLFGQDGWP